MSSRIQSLVRVRHNLYATTAPTATDDSTLGYDRGSVWSNGTDLWLCVDATPGAAVWRQPGLGLVKSYSHTITDPTKTLFSAVDFVEPGFSYTPGANTLQIYIDGVRQFPSEYTEVSSTSFQLNAPLGTGSRLHAWVFDTASLASAIPVSSKGSPGGVAELDANGILVGAQLGQSSLTANGYQKLPGGLILQWGSGAYTDGTAITFPIAFPTGVLSITVTEQSLAADATTAIARVGVASDTVTTTGFTVRMDQATSIYWMAVGH